MRKTNQIINQITNRAMIILPPVMVVMAAAILLTLASGCASLRFAPDEQQKQNAYLHQCTTQAAALQSKQEHSSAVLQKLTQTAAHQSAAIMAYYGLPKNIPSSDNIEQLLSPQNEVLTNNARKEAVKRPDPWGVADGVFQLGIALAGLAGGVMGHKAVKAIQLARQKSIALKEIIDGNELFKKQNIAVADNLKQAQQRQSKSTRTLVAALK